MIMIINNLKRISIFLTDLQFIFYNNSGFRNCSLEFLNYFKMNFLRLLNKTFYKINRFKVFGFIVNTKDFETIFFLYREVFVYKAYDVRISIEDPVIFDCGANIGLTTLFYKYKYPNSKIFAFEPLESNLKYLELNIRSNNIQNVDIFPFALSDSEEEFILTQKENDTAGVMVRGEKYVSKSFIEYEREMVSLRVKSKKLSDFIKKHKVDILKLDVEGAELDILKDLNQNNLLGKVKNITLEYHYFFGNNNNLLSSFLKILEDAQFKIKVSSNLELVPDILFLGNSLNSELEFLTLNIRALKIDN